VSERVQQTAVHSEACVEDGEKGQRTGISRHRAATLVHRAPFQHPAMTAFAVDREKARKKPLEGAQRGRQGGGSVRQQRRISQNPLLCMPIDLTTGLLACGCPLAGLACRPTQSKGKSRAEEIRAWDGVGEGEGRKGRKADRAPCRSGARRGVWAPATSQSLAYCGIPPAASTAYDQRKRAVLAETYAVA
jgi:hypothetical protein